jgi:Transposase DDE domain
MDGFDREVLSRLPLADAVVHLWSLVAQDAFLNRVFDEHRGRCYEKVITFPVLVQLIASALLEHEGSGRASYEAARENGTLTASVWAAFQKLGNIPLKVSEALLSQGSQRLLRVMPDHDRAGDVPASLADFEIVIFDGKAIKRVMKRLKALWGKAGGLLGGRALVAMHFQKGLVLAMATHEDGDANDARFVPELLAQVRRDVPGVRLYVGDRQYCDPTQAERLVNQGDHFVVRYHGKNRFDADPGAAVRAGVDAQGRRVTESWGWLGSPANPRRRYVRRITLERPGDDDLILITDLLDADTYPAVDLLWVYLQRWNIERVFQQVTEVFHLRKLIGSSPKATVFQFGFCLLLYNMIQVIRSYVAQSQEISVDDVSTEKLFEDVTDELVAYSKLSGGSDPGNVISQKQTARQLRAYLKRRLRNVWRPRWTKYTRKQPQAIAKPKAKRQRTHGSVYRIMEDYRLAQNRKNARRSRC